MMNLNITKPFYCLVECGGHGVFLTFYLQVLTFDTQKRAPKKMHVN